MIRGFDVSAFQGSSIPACDFVFVKATEGSSYTSGKFAAQWASAKTHAKVRGAYHFARPEASSAISQADRLIAKSGAKPGEMLCLDLEASKLNQAQTNTWAKAFGDRLREKAPGVTTVVYMGSGYAANGTGKGLSSHFDYWWYPQYPSTAATHTWKSSFTPWIPGGLTCGWTKPHIWQWTDNFGGLDASISTLTTSQLSGGLPTPTPQEEIDMIALKVEQGMDSKTEFPLAPGKVTTITAFADNSYTDGAQVKATAPVKLRVAVLHSTGTWQTQVITVGKATADKTTKVATFVISDAAHAVGVSATRVDGDGTEPLTIGAY